MKIYNKILKSVENDEKTCNGKKRSKASVHITNIIKKLTASEAAKELNIREATVYDWLKKYRGDPKDFMPESGKQKPADPEISRILRENKQLKLENEFLKKRRCILRKTTSKIHLGKE